MQAILDCRVTDSKQPLHLLDRAVASYERGHEHLIFERELRECRELEHTLDCHLGLGQTHALDQHPSAAGHLCEVFPIGHRECPSVQRVIWTPVSSLSSIKLT